MDDSNKAAVQIANTESKTAASTESQSESQNETQSDAKEKASSRKTLAETGNELKKALDAWNDLSNAPRAPSPNEKMLNDVKDLLKQLKNKIEEFK